MSAATQARVVTLFGEIATQAGFYEAAMGKLPHYVLMTGSDADALLDYFSNRMGLGVNIKLTQTEATKRLTMVSGLEVHIIRGNGPLRVG